MLLLNMWREAKRLTWAMVIRMGPFMPMNIAYLAERPIIKHVPPGEMGVSVQIRESIFF